MAAFLQHGSIGPAAHVENEDIRWLVHGLRFAIPDATWDACYMAVSIFRGMVETSVRNRCKGTDKAWKEVRAWARNVARQRTVSFDVVMSGILANQLKQMDPVSLETRLRMVPPGCKGGGFLPGHPGSGYPAGGWCTTGAPVIFGPWRIFKTWVPFEQVVSTELNGQVFTTTNPNRLVALQTGIEWGLDSPVGDPFHSLGFRVLKSPSSITSYQDLDRLPWDTWKEHLSTRLSLPESELFLSPPVSMPMLRTEI